MPVFDADETRTVGPDAPAGESEETTRELEPGTRVYQYEILAELGKGGMGVVYSAQDHALGRQIALKILRTRTSRSGQDISMRLKREAQALAQLSHPNVVHVYEVGDFEGSVFLAMEFVRGPNVRDWLFDYKPDRRTIIEVFAQAGQGLAAAHAADLIHRDFKPDNVIVGDDGRVRVLDFGLARAKRVNNLSTGEHPTDTGSLAVTREPLDTPMPTDTQNSATQDSLTTGDKFGASLLHARLTRGGGVQGTPAYMSPEQFLGEAVDARADQYAYCTALFEALCGYRPIKASNLSSLRRRVIRGKYEAFPTEPRVPRHIQRALLRGLTRDPEERFPDMDALVRELVRDPAARIRRIALLAALAVSIAVASWVLASSRSQQSPPCERVADRINGVWNQGTRAAMNQAFLAGEQSHAGETFQRTAGVLDDYAVRWSTMRTQACEATHVRGEQSERLLDLRMQCLDNRLNHLNAFIALMSTNPTADTINEAVQAAYELPELAQCADVEALNATTPRPTGQHRLQRLRKLEKQLATITTQMHTGAHQDALTAAEQLMDEVRSLDYPPLSAQAGYITGALAEKNSQPEQSERALLKAATVAAQARDDELSAEIWIALIRAIGHAQARFDEAAWVGKTAEVAIVRAGNDPLLRARLDTQLGSVAFASGRTAEAYAKHQKALEMRREQLSENHPDVIESLTNVGATLYRQGRFKESADINRQALELGVTTLGPRHPAMAIAHLNLAVSLVGLTEYERARSHYRDGLTINKQAYGENHRISGYLLASLGELEWLQGQHERAYEAYGKAHAILNKIFGKDHPLIAHPLTGLGQAHIGLGQPDKAIEFLTRAQALREAGKADRADQALTQFYLQRAHWAAGQQTPGVRALARAAFEVYRNDAYHLRAEAALMKQWLDSLPSQTGP